MLALGQKEDTFNLGELRRNANGPEQLGSFLHFPPDGLFSLVSLPSPLLSSLDSGISPVQLSPYLQV